MQCQGRADLFHHFKETALPRWANSLDGVTQPHKAVTPRTQGLAVWLAGQHCNSISEAHHVHCTRVSQDLCLRNLQQHMVNLDASWSQKYRHKCSSGTGRHAGLRSDLQALYLKGTGTLNSGTCEQKPTCMGVRQRLYMSPLKFFHSAYAADRAGAQLSLVSRAGQACEPSIKGLTRLTAGLRVQISFTVRFGRCEQSCRQQPLPFPVSASPA